jgi:hypothetical protein
MLWRPNNLQALGVDGDVNPFLSQTTTRQLQSRADILYLNHSTIEILLAHLGWNRVTRWRKPSGWRSKSATEAVDPWFTAELRSSTWNGLESLLNANARLNLFLTEQKLA